MYEEEKPMVLITEHILSNKNERAYVTFRHLQPPGNVS